MDLAPKIVVSALPRIGPGLAKYRRLQQQLHRTDVSIDREFQRAFNAFYRVRRNEAWQRVFYGLLEREKRSPRDSSRCSGTCTATCAGSRGRSRPSWPRPSTRHCR